MDEQTKQLAESVMKWWEEHKYDTVSLGDGEEDNYFDGVPEFVTLAARLLGRVEL